MKTIVLSLCLLCCGGLSAQWSTNPKLNNPVCTAPNDQTAPQMIADGTGGVIITWTDERRGTDDPNIYAQRIDANGITKWTVDGLVICNASYSQSGAVLAADGKGGAIICWTDGRTDPTNFVSDVYAQRIDSNGVALWPVNGLIVCNAAHRQSQPEIISDKNGGAFIVWLDNRNLLKTDLYMQRINANGVRQWLASGVPVSLSDKSQFGMDMVSDNKGGVVIAWDDDRNNIGHSESTDIYAQRIDGNGRPLWASNGIAVCTAVKGQYLSHIISDGTGGAMLTWVDSRNYGTNEDDIYAQRVDANGTLVWLQTGLPICTMVHEQADAGITTDGRGGAIITWDDERGGGDYDGDIYAQRVTPAGLLKWAADGALVAKADKFRLYPSIISDGNKGAILAWQDYRSGTSEIYTQLINAEGRPQWTLGGAAVCTAPIDRFFSALVSDGRGGAVACWQDYRNGAYSNADVFASRIKVNTIAANTRVDNITSISKAGRLLIYPDPASSVITITGVSGAIDITDINGHIVKKVTVDVNSKPININDLAPGIYYCKAGSLQAKFIKVE